MRDGDRGAALPALSVYTRDVRFIDIFNTGRAPAAWTARASHDWIRLSRTRGDLREDARVIVSIDWARAPKGEGVAGAVEISGAGATRLVQRARLQPRQRRDPAV